MNKIVPTTVQNKIKHITPELIVGASLLAGAAALVYLRRQGVKVPKDFVITEAMLDQLRSKGGVWLIQTNNGKFLLKMTDI